MGADVYDLWTKNSGGEEEVEIFSDADACEDADADADDVDAVADDDDDVVGGQLIVMSLSSVTAATAQ